jgi:putative photosynthetic complex assembly protein
MKPHHHEQKIPMGVLVGAGVMIVFSMVLAGTSRAGLQAELAQQAAAPTLVQRMLRFEDRKDGAIVVVDHDSGETVRVIEPQGGTFIRGIMRSMFRIRKLESLPHESPFRLAREQDGRLTITDPLTARRVDLEAFGSDNAPTFAILLKSQPSRTPATPEKKP